MKHCILLLLALLFSVSLNAQPQGINYQGVARDSAGHPVINQNISLRLSILDSSTTGQAVYVETHNVTTNTSGLFNLSIGMGTTVFGAFADIPWGAGDKWLKVEMDAGGGSNYQLIGVTQFLSVPFALYSKESGSSIAGPQGPSGPQGSQGMQGLQGVPGPQGPGIPVPLILSTDQICNYPTPTEALIIYNSTTKKPCYYDGANWKYYDNSYVCPIYIGLNYQGGIVVYVLRQGDLGYDPNQIHGFIVANNDLGNNVIWGCNDTLVTTNTSLGSGPQNTSTIIATCNPLNAAQKCNDLIFNGYDDWFLPSINELNLICTYRDLLNGFLQYGNWNIYSSSELDSNYVWSLYVSTPDICFIGGAAKYYPGYNIFPFRLF